MKIPSGYYKPFVVKDAFPDNITITGGRPYYIWCNRQDCYPPYAPTCSGIFGGMFNKVEAEFLADLLNSLETSDDPTYYRAGWPHQQLAWIKAKESEGKMGGI